MEAEIANETDPLPVVAGTAEGDGRSLPLFLAAEIGEAIDGMPEILHQSLIAVRPGQRTAPRRRYMVHGRY